MSNYADTSREAWRTFVPVTAELDRAIMAVIEAAGETGITCQGIEEVTGRNHQAVSGNLRHLAERGLVQKSGFYGSTQSGRKAIKWAINPMGPETVETPPARRNRLREAVEKAVRDLDLIDSSSNGSPALHRVVDDLKKALAR